MFDRLKSIKQILVVAPVVTALVIFTAVAATAQIPSVPGPGDHPTDYVAMSDGVLIAINKQFPSATTPAGGWPTIIQIDGYQGGSLPMDPNSPVFGSGNYATVHMSLRGTGCSGGHFDLFDRRSSQDGYEVIEWIASRPWSNHSVAIWGHSYSGLTGWLVASTQPPHLNAMSVSGLIDDLYRGIVYMGGVSNLGFPLLWTGIYRPETDLSGGTAPGVLAGDSTCIANQAGRVPPDVADNAILNGLLALGEDSQWFASHSLITYLDSIKIPTHIVQSYQDEQTGPRGSNLLWQRLDQHNPDLLKRLILTNGVHSTNVNPPEIYLDRIAWLDCFVRGICGTVLNPAQRVSVLFEMHANSSGTLVSNGKLTDPDWPLSITNWTRYYFHSGGGLSTVGPEATASPDLYVSGSKRAGAWTFFSPNLGAPVTTANLPDEVRYKTDPFAQDSAIAGPIDVTLNASSTAVDTEFYVELNDIDPLGNMTRLQRGMLKASHRQIDPYRTDYNSNGDIIRPYNPHTNTLTNLLVPLQIYQYEIEVFPLGHIFRAGHQLLIRVTSPPASDALAVYVPTTPPGVNQVFHDALHPSSILLPAVPLSDIFGLGSPLGCGEQVGLERCSQPIL